MNIIKHNLINEFSLIYNRLSPPVQVSSHDEEALSNHIFLFKTPNTDVPVLGVLATRINYYENYVSNADPIHQCGNNKISMHKFFVNHLAPIEMVQAATEKLVDFMLDMNGDIYLCGSFNQKIMEIYKPLMPHILIDENEEKGRVIIHMGTKCDLQKGRETFVKNLVQRVNKMHTLRPFRIKKRNIL